ncbi:MAG: AAA family ATPase [Bacteriovoracaceae bacterium]|nr:AAA family ATPase [Bacteriovoracaceae bacterium]
MTAGNQIEEKVSGIVNRITFHNQESGWSVLKVSAFDSYHDLVTVTIHQCKVFAGATMDFFGEWTEHPKFGRQFKASSAIEKKPASSAALEKYLGSGLIAGVGPKTAKKIVKYFGKETLDVFEQRIDRLVEVEGIAKKKLNTISGAWEEHRAISKVMMFLQTHGISTLFAVKIFKKYGNKAIEVVSDNPYVLEKDFYGIGFFSADKVALSMGTAQDAPKRVSAAIRHVLSASREDGHCYLTVQQIISNVNQLLSLELDKQISGLLTELYDKKELMLRRLKGESNKLCYYSKSLFYDEAYVGKRVKQFVGTKVEVDVARVNNWMQRYCEEKKLTLSDEQKDAVANIVKHPFSILTGGPGCGKTTTTKTLVALLMAMKKTVLLAAPTGRASQRMGEVIGVAAQTIHRLLVWNPATGGFKKNEEDPLECDVIIIDESSMLDISLSASLFRAIAPHCQVVFIGDADQLPSVGAGNVLKDLIECGSVPVFKLTKIFRQAGESSIIKFAHQINLGDKPKIESPIKYPNLWQDKVDCLFVDSDELTMEQSKFVTRAKQFIDKAKLTHDKSVIIDHLDAFQDVQYSEEELYFETISAQELEGKKFKSLMIPKKFSHVDLSKLSNTQTVVEQLQEVLKKVHPWSSINYGLNATSMLSKIYTESIPKYMGKDLEIQILSPMTRGSLGTANLNRLIQTKLNPAGLGKAQLTIGQKILRVGDRVIQKRNNYDLKVFNGDIGKIESIDSENLRLVVTFVDNANKREVIYERETLSELELAYAITIHKSQGSEFDVVILPIMTQHYKMLFRNLIYTGLTRAKKMAIFIGTRKALNLAVRTNDNRQRQTALKELV